MPFNHDYERECKCDHEYKKEFCDSVKGNAMDIELKKNDCEIRADIVVEREKCVRLWGQVKDCDGNPVKDALVKLLKPVYRYGKIEYVGVAHTITDCLGFYQFDLCPEDEKTKFRVIVGKASKGNERYIDDEGGICNPCD